MNDKENTHQPKNPAIDPQLITHLENVFWAQWAATEQSLNLQLECVRAEWIQQQVQSQVQE